MALTKIGGGVLKQPIDVGIITATSLNASGIVTAGTVQVGAATTVHTTGIDLGSGNITSHNINSTGIITATSFVGPVTGNVTGNTSGTASNLSGSPSINVTNITASGNVSIAGTLTYEDVTNIDSVGIITAQSDISIADKIVHTGDTNTAIRFPADDTVTVETAGTEKLRITSTGKIGIGTDTPDCKLEISNDGYAFPSPAGSSHFRVGNGGGSATIDIAAANTQISGLYFSDTDATARGVIGYHHNGNYFYFGTTDGTERLRINSDGRILIGDILTGDVFGDLTSTKTLSVVDTTNGGLVHIRGQSPKLFFDVTAGGSGEIYLDSSNLKVLSGTPNSVGTERLRITSDGNVGVGTDNPSDKLEVKGNTGAGVIVLSSGDITLTGNDVIGQINFKDYDADAHVGGDQNDLVNIKAIAKHESGGASPFDGSDGEGYDLTFSTSRRSGSNAAFTVSEKLRITSDGKVGIGADVYGNVAPLSKLHVSSTGTTTAIGADHGYLRSSCQILCQASDNANNSKSGIMFSGALHSTDGCSAAVVATHENVAENSETTSLSFYTSHNETLKESLKITSDGEIKIPGSGMITINEGSPSGNFYQEIAYSPGQIGCLYLENFAYYAGAPALVINDQDTNNARVMEDVQFQRNGSMKGYIRINPGSVTYSTSSSDIRTKKNFEDWTEDNLSKFKTLSPQLFNWIEEDDGSEKTKGFIAQDNLEKFPEAYPLTASTDRYAFNPSGMVAYLMKALQEAALKIETLEAAVTALQGS